MVTWLGLQASSTILSISSNALCNILLSRIPLRIALYVVVLGQTLFNFMLPIKETAFSTLLVFHRVSIKMVYIIMLGRTIYVEHISSKIFMASPTFFFKQYACITAPYVTTEGSKPLFNHIFHHLGRSCKISNFAKVRN